MSSKKPQQKGQQGPSEEQTREEPYRPMATPEPTVQEQIDALSLRVKVLEKNCQASHGMR